MWQYIPLQPIPDQEFSVNVTVDGKNIPLLLHLRFNTEGEFWHMDISDGRTGNMLISNMPLVTGEYPAGDRLAQFQHLGIGSCLVLKNTNETDADIPGIFDLGTDFLLVWGSIDE